MMITDYLIDVPLNGHLAKFNNKKWDGELLRTHVFPKMGNY